MKQLAAGLDHLQVEGLAFLGLFLLSQLMHLLLVLLAAPVVLLLCQRQLIAQLGLGLGGFAQACLGAIALAARNAGLLGAVVLLAPALVVGVIDVSKAGQHTCLCEYRVVHNQMKSEDGHSIRLCFPLLHEAIHKLFDLCHHSHWIAKAVQRHERDGCLKKQRDSHNCKL